MNNKPMVSLFGGMFSVLPDAMFDIGCKLMLLLGFKAVAFYFMH